MLFWLCCLFVKRLIPATMFLLGVLSEKAAQKHQWCFRLPRHTAQESRGLTHQWVEVWRHSAPPDSVYDKQHFFGVGVETSF